jgi:hypothetical protein
MSSLKGGDSMKEWKFIDADAEELLAISQNQHLIA